MSIRRACILAQKQFVYYAKDLKNGNPFSSQPTITMLLRVDVPI